MELGQKVPKGWIQGLSQIDFPVVYAHALQYSTTHVDIELQTGHQREQSDSNSLKWLIQKLRLICCFIVYRLVRIAQVNWSQAFSVEFDSISEMIRVKVDSYSKVDTFQDNSPIASASNISG